MNYIGIWNIAERRWVAQRAFSNCSLLYDDCRRSRNKLSVNHDSASGRLFSYMEIFLQRFKEDGTKVTKADIKLNKRSVRKMLRVARF